MDQPTSRSPGDPVEPIDPWQHLLTWMERARKVAQWTIAGIVILVVSAVVGYQAIQASRPREGFGKTAPTVERWQLALDADPLKLPSPPGGGAQRTVREPAPKPEMPRELPLAHARQERAETPPPPGLERHLHGRVVQSTVLIFRPLERGSVMGSGTLIDKTNRLVVTNYHVTAESQQLKVYFPMYRDGGLVTDVRDYLQAAGRARPIRGRSVHALRSRDLVVVQLDQVPDSARALPLAKARPLPGDRVYSVGNASDGGKAVLLWVLTSGTVQQSVHGKFQTGVQRGDPFVLDADLVLTDSPTRPGDSGGPMVNGRGELIAVTQGAFIDTRGGSIFIDVREVWIALRQFAAGRSLVLDLPAGPAVEVANRSGRASASARP